MDRRFLGTDGLTLVVFEDSGAFESNYSCQIKEIFNQAKAEAELEENMKTVENTWNSQELILIQHPLQRNVFMLSGTDELQTVLDDSTTIICIIAASAYGGSFKSRIDDWIKSLKLFREVLDEWLTCQKYWLRLEAIMSAPDIQSQLRHEAELFATLDKHYKGEMTKASKSSLAFPIMTDSKMLDKLKIMRRLFEQITQSVKFYLENKRDKFPRLYFLSNDEVLELLSKSKHPKEMQTFISKCFESVKSIEFESGVKDEDEIIPSSKVVVAVHCHSGEKLVLQKVL